MATSRRVTLGADVTVRWTVSRLEARAKPRVGKRASRTSVKAERHLEEAPGP